MASRVEFFKQPEPEKKPPSGHEMRNRCEECAEPANFGFGPTVVEAKWWCVDCAPHDLRFAGRNKESSQ